LKQKISNIQLIFMIANLILTAPIISLPQFILQQGDQNAWMVPFMIYPFLVLIIFVIFGKKNKWEWLTKLFLLEHKRKWAEICFIALFLIFTIFTLIRDLRAMFDFIAAVLLPTTPNDILMVLSIFAIIYLAMSGIEVIARVTAIHFAFLFIIIALLPFMLINEWHFENLQPLFGTESIPGFLRSFYVTFSWMGEFLFFLIIISNINPVQEVRKAFIIGTALGLFLIFIVLLSALAVLGTKIIRDSAYPSLTLIQQINITDFLDRLDLIITVTWLPTLFTKAAFLFYAINHCLSYLYKRNANKFLLPIAFCIGYLSVLMFKNSMDLLRFSFYTWNLLGLIIEMLLICIFFFVRRGARRSMEEK